MTHNLTVSVDDGLWRQMRKFPEIRWGVVMKNAAKEKLDALAVLKKVSQNARLSEEEILNHSIELGRKVNAGRK